MRALMTQRRPSDPQLLDSRWERFASCFPDLQRGTLPYQDRYIRQEAALVNLVEPGDNVRSIHGYFANGSLRLQGGLGY
jgi:hypothetical protein